jgi:hypothetical protein
VPKAIEVFTPNDVPTFTYVERATHKFEDRLRDALTVPKVIISLSGPSKSGKTVLVNKVVESHNLIPLSGASIRSTDQLWSKVLDWMSVPTERTVTTGSKLKAELGGKAGGKAGIPLVVQGKAEAMGSVGGETSREVQEVFEVDGLAQVVREISDSSFTVFVDDFHYIPEDLQKEIGKQIKEAAECGVRICTASVPHRSDDVVRSNPELRGRVVAIDTNYWTDDELEQIAYRGFRELNADIAPSIVNRLTAEAFGSPQLMQAICLNFCFESRIDRTLPQQKRIEVDFVTLQNVLERTSTLTDFSSMISALHSGPRQRGVERKVFSFTDGSKGDVYRCVLLAMKADPPQLSFPYDEMLRRTRAVVVEEDGPAGSSVAQALTQMEKLAGIAQEAPVIEWDEDVLRIVEPYFLFFLRCSNYLQSLVTKRGR